MENTNNMRIISSASRITLIILAMGLVYMSIVGIEINDTYKNTLQLVVAFYFGQKVNQTNV